jgi:succinate-semialdehyde dehydrogenase/glutarate-semialdehyde dehydrogenase
MLRRLKAGHPYLRSENFIAGKWVPALNHTTVPVKFPAAATSDHAPLGTIANSDERDARSAVDAAAAAFPEWSVTLASKRASLLRAFAARMRTESDVLAEVIAAEAGKVVMEAKGEIAYAASYFDWYAGEAERIYGMLLPPFRGGSRPMVLKKPTGVVGIITPWNFPSAMIARGMAGALAAGCTVVVKPSELTPFSATALAAIAHDVGIPAGVFNVVQSGNAAAIGKELTHDKRVRKICFTGSVRVGKLLASEAAHTMKKLSMELGGNAPFIVFDDADVDRAVQLFALAKFRNSGQTCICPNRVLVHRSIEKRFADGVVAHLANAKLGNSLADDSVTFGPLISRAQRDRVHELVKGAVADGGRVLCGGHTAETVGPNFYQPTVIDQVRANSAICREEIFGPAIPIVPFDTDDEAIRIANDVDVGLAAYAVTNSNKRLWRLGEELQYGMVGLNEGLISAATVPFGGVKDSGVGRDGGPTGIDAFLDIKYVLQGGI